MHKRNILLMSLVLAALLAGTVLLFPDLNRFSVFGILYFPSLLLSVFISGNQAPSVTSGWFSFVMLTLVYWVLILMIYALFIEMRLLRQVVHHLEDEPGAGVQLASEESNTDRTLQKIGKALQDAVSLRRKRWLLSNLESLDLSEAPATLAAKAITTAGTQQPVKGLLKHLEADYAAKHGEQAAADYIVRLKKAAQAIAKG